MIRRLFFPLLTILLAVGLLSGCGADNDTTKPSPKQKKTVAKTPVKPKEATAPEEEVKEAPQYVYTAEGKRDPFKAIVQVQRVSLEAPEQLTPLQKFDLAQLKLIGIILGKGDPVAMVIAPDQKSYILKKGIKVGRNGGVVTSVEKDAVLVRETYLDMMGKEQQSFQKIQLPQREGV
ncbi:pilus assembly protein PilP [Desulfuromonas sp. KJ2020]|uniref:pilus assembly protein PilP n=1 Tax=Desulfuromonas sp. KJ2020 TaxID=2919173 RepID=UPI000325D5A6|nr:pilus assembly protein PilP [Desulfuromonas sp. KJ2020]MCP3177420.1 pilus assembly protein PilP [Desulfuromonas sp. KJ2020]